MELIFNSGIFFAGAIAGIVFYRYMVKNDPAKLEKWMAEAKAAGKKIKSNFDA